jgi:hypothetical protein
LGYAFLVSLPRPVHAAAGLLAALLLSIALAGCESSGVSRTVQMAERPIWTAGTSWTYRGRGPAGAYTVTRKVLREGTFQGRDCYEIEAGDARYWYTTQLGYLARTQGDKTVRLASPPEDWQWPLQVGKQWSATVTWTDSGAQERTYVLTGVWMVEAYEEIKVPAGTFKAFKVSRREIESGASQNFWYSPEVKGWVKVRGTNTADGNYEEELTAFSAR